MDGKERRTERNDLREERKGTERKDGRTERNRKTDGTERRTERNGRRGGRTKGRTKGLTDGQTDGQIDLLTAVRMTPGGSNTVHIYTQTIQRTTQLIWEECGPCPVFANNTLEVALQLRKKHGKTSVRVEKPQSGFTSLLRCLA